MSNNIHSAEEQANIAFESGVHDAKNALFGSLLRLDMALSNIKDGETVLKTHLLEARNGVGRALQRLEKGLETKRLITGAGITRIPVVISDMISDALDKIHEMEDFNQVVSISCDEDLVWLIDKDLITDCLVNALQNAVRSAKSMIVIEVTPNEDFMEIIISDDGAGFSNELLEKGVHFGSDGHGMGLFIAQKVAALHKSVDGKHSGRLVLSNKQDMGAIFSMELPK